MLSLIDVTKTYATGNEDVKALKGVSMSFRKSEFVSVLGPSGCGKTTLLNIIGGLDRYTSGDLVINGVSTKNYKDGDWDAYRNHSVGFVFQSYNLIPHQTVIKNVELALTLSGIGKEERRRRAKEALERVGLADQINKKPNQLSGGQMQRVAIARAIVNDPEIILADEPTGALDSETSVQIMEILKELSSNRLIVMVTHNGELAKEYSTRIISLSDGLVIGDTDPYTENGEESEAEANETQGEKKPKKQKKPSMSFLTALSLSLNNLFTKKARTILTAFAGSIGIIGIALILSLSAGFNSYIGDVQRDTLSNYPLTINKSNLDTTAMIGLFAEGGDDKDLPSFPKSNEITSQDLIENLLVNVNSLMSENNLVKFKEYLDENADPEIINAIRYAYNLNLSVFFDSPDDEEPLRSVSPVVLPNFNDVAGEAFSYLRSYYMLFEQLMRTRGLASELLDNARLLDSQYEVLAGNWPERANQAVILVDEHNQIADISLYMLGLMNDKDITYVFHRLFIKMSDDAEVERTGKTPMTEEELDAKTYEDLGFKRSRMSYNVNELLNLKYRIVTNAENYKPTGETQQGGTFPLWVKRTPAELLEYVGAGNYQELEVCGIVRLREGITSGSISTPLSYTKEFTDLMMARNNSTAIVNQLLAEKRTGDYFSVFDGSFISESGHLEECELVNVIDSKSPQSIRIYPSSFEAKDSVIAFIDEYNANAEDKKDQIKYTDTVGILMNSVTIIVNAITYVLIAFVSISLVVSSIMIAVITHISVLERTKEIGVLRSIGASKRDVSRVFNAETFIIGLAAGVMGILITLILIIPINIIIKSLAGLVNIAALPIWGAFALIAISVVLTVVAGLIPASTASKKDPVVALRTE